MTTSTQVEKTPSECWDARRNVRASVCFLVAYFLYFNWDRVKMPFASDDMMNLGVYFRLAGC